MVIEKLTVNILTGLAPRTIFAYGESSHDKIDYGKPFRWIAKRGIMVDWVVLYGPIYEDYSIIAKTGKKMIEPRIIQSLVRCNTYVWSRYGY